MLLNVLITAFIWTSGFFRNEQNHTTTLFVGHKTSSCQWPLQLTQKCCMNNTKILYRDTINIFYLLIQISSKIHVSLWFHKPFLNVFLTWATSILCIQNWLQLKESIHQFWIHTPILDPSYYSIHPYAYFKNFRKWVIIMVLWHTKIRFSIEWHPFYLHGPQL